MGVNTVSLYFWSSKLSRFPNAFLLPDFRSSTLKIAGLSPKTPDVQTDSPNARTQPKWQPVKAFFTEGDKRLFTGRL